MNINFFMFQQFLEKDQGTATVWKDIKGLLKTSLNIHTKLRAMANTLENSPSLLRSVEGIGVFILVPIGFPLSSMSTTLLESNLGVMVEPGILCPTIKAFFFSPLIARRILSPTLPTPVLLYTWIHFGGRWYGVFPKALLSTTRTRVSFCIARHAPVMLPKDRREWETELLNNPWGAKANLAQNLVITQTTRKAPATNTYHTGDTLTAFNMLFESQMLLWALHTLH